MERNLKASILHGLAAILALGGAGIGLYILLMGISTPTVTDDFNNKLLFYSLLFTLFGWHLYNTFFQLALKQFSKARLHLKLRRLNHED